MTPSPLELRLLGHPVILLNGHPLENLPSRTAEALLVFLALQPHPVSREFLAELLWSERTQDQALANLRSILSSLRKAVGDYVLATRQNVAFNRALPFMLDVEQFEQTIERLPLQRQTAPLSPETATQLETALAHYRGDFLEGFYLREGRGFEEWAALLRERLRRLAHLGFRARVRHALENGNYREGIQASEKLIAIDPYDEEARRQLMTLLLRNGNRNTALKQYETLRKLLHEDLGVEPAPTTRAVYERVRALTFPPPFALPPDPTPFIGREPEIETVWQTLAAPEHRLLTLFGPGGIGKTRLAIEVARRLVQHRPGQFLDGIFFVSLVTAPAAQAIVTLVAEEIGFHFHGTQAPQTQLIEYVQGKEILLILDDFERFLGKDQAGILFLIELLSKAPHLKLMVTSRERLNLYEEVVFDLPGLALPDPAQENPETFSAVALFSQVARRVKTGFVPSREEAQTVVHICRLLDGTPLALELAASWVRRYPLAEIYRNLAESLDFLQASYRNLPARHRSLRAVFDHSWALLPPVEQAVFCQLAIFEGAFSREAAEAVISFQASVFRETTGPHTEEGALKTEIWLASLADKSLLQPQEGGRYTLHPLLRQFAAEKQAEFTDAQDTTSQRHAHYYLGFVAQQKSGEDPAERTALRLELANIRTAWAWAVYRGQFSLLGQAIPILSSFFSIQSWFQEGIELFEMALTGLGEGLPPTVQQASVMCELFGRKARMGIHIGQLQMARSDLEKAQIYLAAVNDLALRSKILDSLAISYYYAGDYPKASQIGEEILALAEDNLETRAFALNFLGSCAKVQGEYEQAFTLFNRSVEVYKAMDDPTGAAMSLNNLGNLAQTTGQFSLARQYYQESSTLFKVVDHLHGASTTLANEGKLALREGAYAEARKLLAESLELKEKMNDQRGKAVALVSLGDVSVQTGEVALARQQYTEALTLAHTSGDVRLVLEILVACLEFWGRTGAREEAARLWAFVRVHPALSQEGRARGELAASTLPEVAGAGTVLEEVVDGVFSRLGMG